MSSLLECTASACPGLVFWTLIAAAISGGLFPLLWLVVTSARDRSEARQRAQPPAALPPAAPPRHAFEPEDQPQKRAA
jgi:hypothetical protein